MNVYLLEVEADHNAPTAWATPDAARGAAREEVDGHDDAVLAEFVWREHGAAPHRWWELVDPEDGYQHASVTEVEVRA